MRMHESRELCLEEVKSKATEHPAATGDEARVAMDGDVEVVVEKDVLVEEYTRSETTHEEKVTFCACYSFHNLIIALLLDKNTHYVLLSVCHLSHLYPRTEQFKNLRQVFFLNQKISIKVIYQQAT